MKNSTGVVMQLEKRHAFIMTNTGEFHKVKIGKQLPVVGEIYCGEIYKKVPIYKYASMAASLAFVLFFGGVSYAYYTPVASVVVDINPSIELKVNRWDRILKSIPLNDDGVTVLNTLNVKNKSLNQGLDLIVEEAKKDNFINESYIESGKVITVSVKENKLQKDIDLSNFKESAKKSNLTVEINNNSDEVSGKAKKFENNSTDPGNDDSLKANGKEDQNNNGNNIDKQSDIKSNGNSDNKNSNDNKNNPSNNNNSSNGNGSNKEDKNKGKEKKTDNKSSNNSSMNGNSQDKQDEIGAVNSQDNKNDHQNNKEKQNDKPKK